MAQNDPKVGTKDLEANDHYNQLDIIEQRALRQVYRHCHSWVEHASWYFLSQQDPHEEVEAHCETLISKVIA